MSWLEHNLELGVQEHGLVNERCFIKVAHKQVLCPGNTFRVQEPDVECAKHQAKPPAHQRRSKKTKTHRRLLVWHVLTQVTS
ncbi:hypothetical protein PGIGA_G00174550 [Pangasianodon gigas]|uniref:Uncharacterized protein n=1 Tax=Pangasianodon gigas TaxID=30993 RepID=A0ACC5XUM8_PANGG|nr:hypothetical protein [Pangasianodon gigas]